MRALRLYVHGALYKRVHIYTFFVIMLPKSEIKTCEHRFGPFPGKKTGGGGNRVQIHPKLAHAEQTRHIPRRRRRRCWDLVFLPQVRGHGNLPSRSRRGNLSSYVHTAYAVGIHVFM